MTYTPGHVEGQHVVLTGPITGTVTLSDGEVIDVSQDGVVARDEAHAAEIAHAIGVHWAQPENIHPGQHDVDEHGKPVLRDFVYDDSHHKAAVAATKKKRKA